VNIQVAGSERGTRDRVLAAITARGPISASALGRELELTPAAVRRHLDALAADGAIVERESPLSASTPRGRGRPARQWVAAPAGLDSLPGDYDDLAVEVLRFLRERAGGEAVAGFARRRAAQLQGRYAADLAAAGSTLTAKAHALVEALSRDGFAASARPVAVGGLTGVQVCQGHCPVRHVAAEFPELCQAETDAFSKLLGVHVQRLSTLAAGQHVCTTFVPTASVSEPGGAPTSSPLSAASSPPKGLLA
jgi:predicted ArsR family transcriptional regulator